MDDIEKDRAVFRDAMRVSIEDRMNSCSPSVRWIAATLNSEGVIASLSPVAEQLTGYSAAELVGRPVTQILGDRSVFEFSNILKTADEWGIWEGEIVHRDRSGRSLPAQASLSQLSGRENMGIGYMLLSVLKGGEAAVPGNVATGEVASRLRAIAHELNNPLAVIMGFTQLILLNEQCDGKVRADLERLHGEMERIVRVVEKLQSYAMSLQSSRRYVKTG